MNRYNLQQCPFCAGEMLEVVTDDNDNHLVLCNDCQAQGPAASDEYHAIKAWNEREGA